MTEGVFLWVVIIINHNILNCVCGIGVVFNRGTIGLVSDHLVSLT